MPKLVTARVTTTDILVILGGGFIGYWVVSNLLTGSSTPSGPNGNLGSSDQNQSSSRYEHGEQKGDTCTPQPEGPISANWFRILEVSEYASKEQIVAAYKKKISQYHPDKVSNLGRELQELAELKTKQINASYDFAMKLRD